MFVIQISNNKPMQAPCKTIQVATKQLRAKLPAFRQAYVALFVTFPFFATTYQQKNVSHDKKERIQALLFDLEYRAY